MNPIQRYLANLFQCKTCINKKAICIKRSWDEVATLLNCASTTACCPKKKEKKKRRRH